MGFAYGHLSSKAVAVAGHTGRGLAAQQILEEFSSQKGLNANVGNYLCPVFHLRQGSLICASPPLQVRNWIGEGVHLTAGDEVYMSWGKRILNTRGILFLDSQRLILRLLADFREDRHRLLEIVDGIGGVWELFLRFFRHYNVRRSHDLPIAFLFCLLAATANDVLKMI